MKNTIVIVFCFLLTLIGCNESRPSEKKSEKEKPMNKAYSIDKEYVNDKVELSLQLESKMINVYSKVAGMMQDSELKNNNAQWVDSTTIIVAIDNRENFLKLKKEKTILKEELIKSRESLKKDMWEDLDKCLGLIRSDNLLPEISTTEFSKEYVNWFKDQSFYKDYLQAMSTENSMNNYFYLNETSVYLSKLYVKKGDYVKKNQLLYSYLSERALVYSAVIDFRKEDIDRVIEGNTRKVITNFTVKDGRLVVIENARGEVLKSKNVHVYLKKTIS